jgi:hypothetical protein
MSLWAKILKFVSSPPCRDVLVICRGAAIYPGQNSETVETLSRSGPGFLFQILVLITGRSWMPVTGLRLVEPTPRRDAGFNRDFFFFLIYPESGIQEPVSLRIKQRDIYAANSSVWGGASPAYSVSHMFILGYVSPYPRFIPFNTGVESALHW